MNDYNQENTYQTGSTTPPKGHSSLIAILLVLVIFLSGLVSILSFLNIRMFSVFYEAQQEKAPLSLEISHYPADGDLLTDGEPISVSGSKTIGITGDAISPVYQRHFDLPEGLFITHVEEGSTAQSGDIREGDVLLSLDDIPITDTQALQTVLAQKELNETCTARIYRPDEQLELTVILNIEELE